MKQKTTAKIYSFLLSPFEPRKAKSCLPRFFFRGFISRDVCVFIGIVFCFLTFCLSCERDFSPVKITAHPDTTSHNFTWQIDTFGVISSYLFDVAIINENDIWAVGAIQPDPTGVSDIYNAIHWNGQQWELMRIPYIYNGQPFYHPMNFSFSFKNGEVWFGGNGIVRWNGINFSNVEIDQNAWGPVAINKMWGKATDDVVIVGDEGSIAHYDGSSWQKLESGTTVDIQDIWGAINPQSGEYEVLVIASERSQIPQARELLQIQGTMVSTLSDSGLPYNLRSLWFVPAKKYYVAGNGLYFNSALGQPWQYDDSQPLFYKDAIRGNAENDIIIAGSFGNVSHFNGSTWRHYQLPYFYGRYHCVSMKGDMVVAVGEIGGGLAIILRGRRS